MTGAREEGLAPCPFCGAQPNIFDAGDANGPSYWAIACSGCHGHLDHYFPDGEPGEGRAQAIAAWNRRSAPSAGEGLEAFERELRKELRRAYVAGRDDGIEGAMLTVPNFDGVVPHLASLARAALRAPAAPAHAETRKEETRDV